GGPGGAVQERTLVRYDRLTAGHLAWLRVTVADLAVSTPLKACLSSPPTGIKLEGGIGSGWPGKKRATRPPDRLCGPVGRPRVPLRDGRRALGRASLSHHGELPGLGRKSP